MKRIILTCFIFITLSMFIGCNDSKNTETFNLIYNTQDGKESTSVSITVKEGVFSLYTPYREGYSFIGWYNNSDYKGDILTDIPTNLKEDISLYAKWEINQYTLSYIETDILYNSYLDALVNVPTKIAKVVMGREHGGCITEDNRLYMFGSNGSYELGNMTNNQSQNPIDISSYLDLNTSELIIELVVGSGYTGILTSEGRVFMWGSNQYSLISDDTSVLSYKEPTDITSRFNLDEDEKIISISSGRYHIGVITSKGKIFMWGRNQEGQLGINSLEDTYNPVNILENFQLNDSETISEISIGDYSSGAKTSEGRIFMWGSNEDGQLGNQTSSQETTPLDVTPSLNLLSGETVIDLDLGNLHTGVVTSFGRVLTWGYNYHGQLGDNTSTNKAIPTDITSFFNLSENEEIKEFELSVANSYAITSENRIFVWGMNGFGQLGDGTSLDKHVPTDITSQFSKLDIKEIAFGGFKSYACNFEGEMFVWGEKVIFDGEHSFDSTNPIQLNFILFSIIGSVSLEYGQTITLIEPTKEGYIFDGWYLDGLLETEYDYNTMPAKDITLYAKWIPID